MDSQAGGSPPEVISIAGVRVPLDPSLMSPTIIDHLRAGRWDNECLRLLSRLVGPGDRVVHLGAGIGITSAVAGLRRPERLVAVEADPAMIPLIEQVHRLNGVCSTALNGLFAARRRAATEPFYVHQDLWASSAQPVAAKHLKQVVDVPVMDVADLAAAYAPSLLVIDLEVLAELVPTRRSSETDTLALVDFRSIPRVVAEFKPKLFGPTGIRRTFEVFAAQGFAYDPAFSSGGVVLFRREDDWSLG